MNYSPELIPWLYSKLAEAEKALRGREQAEQCWANGTNAEWDASSQLHPSTAGKATIKKKERIELSIAQGRMADKRRRDVAMFKALIAIVEA